MKGESTPVRQARLAAGISIAEAARTINVTPPTYIKKENSPGLFTLDEFSALREKMPNFSAGRMLDCLDEMHLTRH